MIVYNVVDVIPTERQQSSGTTRGERSSMWTVSNPLSSPFFMTCVGSCIQWRHTTNMTTAFVTSWAVNILRIFIKHIRVILFQGYIAIDVCWGRILIIFFYVTASALRIVGGHFKFNLGESVIFEYGLFSILGSVNNAVKFVCIYWIDPTTLLLLKGVLSLVIVEPVVEWKQCISLNS